jgi:lipid-A-disaccharide synthase
MYIIHSQIWAWKENRIVDIKRDIDMYVILPFEKRFYEDKHGFLWNLSVTPIDAIHNQAIVDPIIKKKTS